MIYRIGFTDPSKEKIIINPGEVNLDTSIGLLGKNYKRYGEIVAESFLHLLENFSYDEPPENPVEGQLWYNNEDKKIRLWDGTDWRLILDSVESGITENVYYVAKNGSDSNSGRSLADPFLTIDRAMEVIKSIDDTGTTRAATTVFVKSGTYRINNPVYVPKNVAIVGDSLRTVTVRPQNPTLDMFWVTNATYLTQMTFKGHKSPSAAVAFPTDGSAGIITTSPYVQNCSSITSTGTGMRVDGLHTEGLKSMVVDAFTQYNQGGIGIHMLNLGNTQLVSVFTICCHKAIYCENGGFCSLTNSNSSFGDFALYSEGVSEPLYGAKVISQDAINIFRINNLTKKPNIGDGVKFVGDENYYTINETTDLTINSADIVLPAYSTQPSELLNAQESILSNKRLIKIETINYLTNTYPEFIYDQFKCSRDIGYIIDSVVDDMVFGSNYRSIVTGLSYYRTTADKVLSEQLTETIDAIQFVRDSILALLQSGTTPYIRVSNLFSTMIAIINNGESSVPARIFENPTNGNLNRIRAKDILQINRSFLIEEGIAYIAQQYPSLSYNQTKCRRDIGFIVDAITYDTLYFGNSQTADVADEYYNGGVLQLPAAERQATIDTYNYIKNIAADCVVNIPVTRLNTTILQNTTLPASNSTQVSKVLELFGLIIELLTNGYTVVIGLEEAANGDYNTDTTITFHQFSLIVSSGHTFEWIGAGTNINTALPYLGGVAIRENQVIQVDSGRVYFTGTDQRGDFRIGNELTINRARGTIEGRVFRRSLYGIMTPYILGLQE